MRSIFVLATITLSTLASCRKEHKENISIKETIEEKTDSIKTAENTEDIYKRPNYIIADLDGDKLQDSVIIITNPVNKKEGFRIVYANKTTDTIGMGREVMGQGFDEISWAGIFEKAPKGEKYVNNVDENGEFLDIEEIPEKDWITLPNDAIYIHMVESCGGGIIYLDKGEYKWIQQE